MKKYEYTFSGFDVECKRVYNSKVENNILTDFTFFGWNVVYVDDHTYRFNKDNYTFDFQDHVHIEEKIIVYPETNQISYTKVGITRFTTPANDLTGHVKEVFCHEAFPSRNNIKITVEDAPDKHSASHVYTLSHKDKSFEKLVIKFQKGEYADVGVNGVTNEALLAVIVHRLNTCEALPVYNFSLFDTCKKALYLLEELKAISVIKDSSKAEDHMEGTEK